MATPTPPSEESHQSMSSQPSLHVPTAAAQPGEGQNHETNAQTHGGSVTAAPPAYALLPGDAPGDSGQVVDIAEEGTDGGEASRTKTEESGYSGSYRPVERIRSGESSASLGQEAYGYNTGLGDATAPQQFHEDVAPPPYSDNFATIENQMGDVGTHASVANDGRVNIHISQHGRKLTNIFAPALRSQAEAVAAEPALPPPYIPPSLGGEAGQVPPPPMNVVIHVVGSRGDVQPFVALGKVLKDTYNHRVRLATHPTFKKFVEENGLEFFSIGGDPAELMAFMVKNPGLMPGFDTLRSGDIGKRRRGIAEMLGGCWRSCFESGDGTGVPVSRHTVEEWMAESNSVEGDAHKPFVADAIIANPPSFAHVHCAEKLGIPLHIMFT
jgi:hypothetical protein